MGVEETYLDATEPTRFASRRTLWTACSLFVPVAIIANVAVEATPHVRGIGFSPQLRYAVVTPLCALVCLLAAILYPVLMQNAKRPRLSLGALLIGLAILGLGLMATLGSPRLARNAVLLVPCTAIAIALLVPRFIEHPVRRFGAVALTVLATGLLAGLVLALLGEHYSAPPIATNAGPEIPRNMFDVDHRVIVLPSGARIHYVDVGTGPTLLFLHGNPSWSFQWRDLIDGLRGSFRCIALDYPGFGLSSAQQGYGYTPREQSRVVEEFVSSLGLHDLTLVLQDWGGPIGIGFAERRPDLVKSIVLGSTWAWPTSKSEPRGQWSVVAGSPIGEFAQINFNGIVSFSLKTGILRTLPKEVTEVYEGPFQPIEHRGIAAFYPREITAETDYFVNLEAGLSHMGNKKALIFWASKDPGFLGADLARWEKSFPSHRTVVLPNANHFFFEDTTQQVIEEIRTFAEGEAQKAE